MKMLIIELHMKLHPICVVISLFAIRYIILILFNCYNSYLITTELHATTNYRLVCYVLLEMPYHGKYKRLVNLLGIYYLNRLSIAN